jgi:hypothetical protein
MYYSVIHLLGNSLGLYTGRTGIAYAAARVAALLSEKSLATISPDKRRLATV